MSTDPGLTRTFQTGEYICRQGDPGDKMYVIRSGRVQIQKQTDSGQIIDYAVLRPGDFLGEMALIETAPRSASALALEPTRAITIDRDNLLTVIKEQPELTLKIMRMLCSRLREANLMVEDRSISLEGAVLNSDRLLMVLAGLHYSFEEMSTGNFTAMTSFDVLSALTGLPPHELDHLFKDIYVPNPVNEDLVRLANLPGSIKKRVAEFGERMRMAVTPGDHFDEQAWLNRIRMEKNNHLREKLVRKYRVLCDLNKPGGPGPQDTDPGHDRRGPFGEGGA